MDSPLWWRPERKCGVWSVEYRVWSVECRVYLSHIHHPFNPPEPSSTLLTPPHPTSSDIPAACSGGVLRRQRSNQNLHNTFVILAAFPAVSRCSAGYFNPSCTSSSLYSNVTSLQFTSPYHIMKLFIFCGTAAVLFFVVCGSVWCAMCGVWSVECGVWSVEWGMESVDRGV